MVEVSREFAVEAGGYVVKVDVDAETRATKARAEAACQMLAIVRTEVLKTHRALMAMGMRDGAADVQEASVCLLRAIQKIEGCGILPVAGA